MIDLDKIEKECSVMFVIPCMICDKEINVYPHENGGLRICGECKSRLNKLLYRDKEQEGINSKEKIDSMIHFFETEIKHAEQHIADDNCYAFNGVDFFPDREKVIKLNKNHIKFCRMVLKRLENKDV